ncbi:hypothetical protein KFE80_00310 [bacterium SCSIO 12696]|nr:hypothetical protein KFE80_00310 [bacterium SCSIO 12696]
MPKEIFLFMGAVIGALAAYITAKATGNKQLEIAKLNAQKEITLQENMLHDERIKSEVSLEREKLESLHIILSKIALENSQTMSHIQSDSNTEIESFRERYLDNCSRLHQARAIVDIYYPDMSESVREIYGKANVFWGHQEAVIRINIKENPKGWNSNLSEVLKAGDEIAGNVKQLQYNISSCSKELNKVLHRTSR